MCTITLLKHFLISPYTMSAVASDPAGKGILLKADPIAAAFLDEVKRSIAQGAQPRLVGILSTSAAPSKSYAEFTKKQCEALGIDFVLKKTGAALSADLQEGEGAEEAIIEANDDSSVDGVMVCRYSQHDVFSPIDPLRTQVYYPIFGGRQDHYLQQVPSSFRRGTGY
jgi:methylenetetrahydrofolate dehydrogenase (NAD+)